MGKILAPAGPELPPNFSGFPPAYVHIGRIVSILNRGTGFPAADKQRRAQARLSSVSIAYFMES